MGRKAGCKIFFVLTGFLLIISLIIIITGCTQKEEPAATSTRNSTALSGEEPAETPIGQSDALPAKVNPANFLTLYPGAYTAKEKDLVKKYLADNNALEERGAVITAMKNGALPEDTPGFARTIKVTETMVRYFNGMRDPENPIYNNADYARQMGYKDIIAYPAFAAHDDSFMVPYPTAARDTLLVADLIHSNTFYRPIYPGDTLYLINNKRTVEDQTPEEGSIYRSIALATDGSIYNQNGEKVMDVRYTVQENIKIYKEGLAPENPTFADFWEEWESGEPAGEEASSQSIYYYTDEDWETIKDIWSKEKAQGVNPLYWEDVKIGDQPAWTLEGPLDSGITVAVPWGMGLGGNRSLKKEIMDTEIFKTLIRDEKDGIYRPADLREYIPAIPAEAGTGQAFGEMGAVDAQLGGSASDTVEIAYGGGGMMNFARRDLAVRHLNNWIGYHGWIYNIRWGGLYSRDMIATAHGRPHPASNPKAENFLAKVPEDILNPSDTSSVKSGSFIIVKSYVYDKFVLNGEFYVDLAWWIKTFPGGGLWGNGGATVRLPSKNTK
ncbi:MAG: MaoC family dehydratase N-terminal domain-containing protein [Deltaproteobacteria bacterium]|nr:MaoC family dehydratase N-terminal domain-containing protein [Deltaproteobacteria bacterium]